VVIEYTFNRDGPRELALRQAKPSKLGNQITETVMRLDLRDPENLTAARALVDAALPWPPDVFDRARAVGERIRTHGIIETTTSTVDDQTTGASASGEEEIKFGFSYKHLKVHRTLISATARTGGPFNRRRLDCLPGAQG